MTIMTYEIATESRLKTLDSKRAQVPFKAAKQAQAKDVAAIIKRHSKTPIEYREGGGLEKRPGRNLSFRALVRRAANGNSRSMEMVLTSSLTCNVLGIRKSNHRSPDWLPDYPGQTGEQKTRDSPNRAKPRLLSGGSDPATIDRKKEARPRTGNKPLKRASRREDEHGGISSMKAVTVD